MAEALCRASMYPCRLIRHRALKRRSGGPVAALSVARFFQILIYFRRVFDIFSTRRDAAVGFMWTFVFFVLSACWVGFSVMLCWRFWRSHPFMVGGVRRRDKASPYVGSCVVFCCMCGTSETSCETRSNFSLVNFMACGVD